MRHKNSLAFVSILMFITFNVSKAESSDIGHHNSALAVVEALNLEEDFNKTKIHIFEAKIQ